jgi:hypothetical protein
MKLFTCSVCRQLLFFENVRCTGCGHVLAYLPDRAVLSALAPVAGAPGLFEALAPVATGASYRLCANSTAYGVCNWAVPAAGPHPLCRSCRFNDVIPNLSRPGARDAWQRLEAAKRRLLYTLIGLGLPLESDGGGGLAFSFKEDEDGGRTKVFTGHSHGLITINVAEADEPFREKMRQKLGEAHRTLLGHFRHEIGHYYWDRLIRDSSWLERFRAAFGDERADYGQALQRHYDGGAPADWQERFVSAYASTHPWEDWAETFAHYLHMVDTLETARSFGMALRPVPVGGAPAAGMAARRLDFDDFDDLISAWLPLTIAVNSLNRGMGLLDLYPFVLSTTAIGKLRFIHDLVEVAAAPAR